MVKILIVGATGSIGRTTRSYLIEHSDDQLTLMARDVSGLGNINAQREKVVQADVTDQVTLARTISGQDVVFASLSGNLPIFATSIVDAMHQTDTPKLIFISSMGIYNEIPASVGTDGNLDVNPALKPYRVAADIVEASGLNYTVIRPGWFDNGDPAYEVTKKGEPFGGHDVARESIADLVMRLAHDFSFGQNASLGINRPS